MSVFTPEQRVQHEVNAAQLMALTLEHQELPHGYAFRFSTAAWESAALFVKLERMCCPFFDFRLDLAHDGDLWLTVSGREGAKAVLEAELGEIMP